MRVLLIAMVGLVMLAGAASAGTVLINDGLSHIINDETYSGDWVTVRNVDCPPGWPEDWAGADCPEPRGDPTELTLEDPGVVLNLVAYDSSVVITRGGTVNKALYVHDSSTVTMNEGTVLGDRAAYDSYASVIHTYDSSTAVMNEAEVKGNVGVFDTSTFTVNGGDVWRRLLAGGTSSVTINGGIVGGLSTFQSATAWVNGGWVKGWLRAYDASTIIVLGSHFAVDGVPVPYGDLTAQTGILVGIRASGQLFYQGFLQGQSSGPYTGTITLAPPPVDIDIKPWSDTNPVNPFARGVIPVAILGSEAFDVADVDVTTLAFGADAAPPVFDLTHPLFYWLAHRDVNHDGEKDLLSYYRTQETGIAFGDTQACLAGETLDGIPLEGCDVIDTVSGCGHGFEVAFLVPPVIWMRQRRKRCTT